MGSSKNLTANNNSGPFSFSVPYKAAGYNSAGGAGWNLVYRKSGCTFRFCFPPLHPIRNSF